MAVAARFKNKQWAELRRAKGALSDAQGLLRVVQSSQPQAEAEGGAAHDPVAEYGRRELAAKDQMRAENITLRDHADAMEASAKAAVRALGLEQRERAGVQAELGAAAQQLSALRQVSERASERAFPCRYTHLRPVACDM